MAGRILNRGGFESTRNLAKRFKPPRVIRGADKTETLHPLDVMKFLPERTGKQFIEGGLLDTQTRDVNTTGCFGTVNTVSPTRVNLIIKSKYPGRERGGAKKKRPSKLFVGNIEIDYKKASFEQLRNLRANLLTARIMGSVLKRQVISRDFDKLIEHITEFLVRVHGDRMREEFKLDKQRVKSTTGMINSGKVEAKAIKSIDLRVERALFNMRIDKS